MKQTKWSEGTLTKFWEELMARGIVDLAAAEQTAQHSEVLATGCGPEHAPFLRDLLLLEPADPQQPPRPDWLVNAVLRVQMAFFQFGLPGKSDDLAERLGSLGGMALNVQETPLPLENPSAEVQASWDALTRQVRQAIQEAQQKANDLPKTERAQFFGGFGQGGTKDPLSDEMNVVGQYAPLYLATIQGWREILYLRSRREFGEWLAAKLGAQVVGDRKRVEHFCAEIGLKFKLRGRPRNEANPSPKKQAVKPTAQPPRPKQKPAGAPAASPAAGADTAAPAPGPGSPSASVPAWRRAWCRSGRRWPVARCAWRSADRWP
jgi:hypothetical protein